MLSLETALDSVLKTKGQPVISAYDLYVELWRLYRHQTLNNEPIRIQKKAPSFGDYSRVVRRLIDRHVVSLDQDFSKDPLTFDYQHVILRVNSIPDRPAEDICALIDPFCYISHLSAMQRYTLTNRNPDQLMLSTPSTSIWRELRDIKMSTDYGAREYNEQIKQLDFVELPEKIRGRPIVRHETKYPAQFVKVRETSARIAKIGDTFEQMLDKPEWCGGMTHVLEVWERHAKTFLNEIVEAINRSPRSIIKVRAGYILNERLEIADARVDSWSEFAQRGGSRKLDPSGNYKPHFSERWMISINV